MMSWYHKKNSLGIAPIVLVFIVSAIVIGMVGGYTLMNKKGNSVIPSLKGMTLNAKCKYNDPDLCKYINRLSTDASLYENTRITSTMTDTNGVSSRFVFESAGKGRSHTVSYQNGKELFNTVTIADTVYTKDMSDNKWWKQTYKKEDPKREELRMDKGQIKDLLDKTGIEEDKTEFVKMGKERCGKLTCFKYEVKSPLIADGKTTMYFDDKEYMLRKMVTQTQGITNTMQFSYGEIKINTPSPIKEVPEGQVPGAASDVNKIPSKEELEKMMKDLPQVQDDGSVGSAIYENTQILPDVEDGSSASQ